MHGHPQPQPGPQPPLRLPAPGRPKAGRRRYKTFMIDEILSKETCDYFEKLSLYSVCPSLLVRPKPLHSCAGKRNPSGARGEDAAGAGSGVWGERLLYLPLHPPQTLPERSPAFTLHPHSLGFPAQGSVLVTINN